MGIVGIVPAVHLVGGRLSWAYQLVENLLSLPPTPTPMCGFYTGSWDFNTALHGCETNTYALSRLLSLSLFSFEFK